MHKYLEILLHLDNHEHGLYDIKNLSHLSTYSTEKLITWEYQ